MGDYIYLSDAFRALRKITNDSDPIFESLENGTLRVELPIHGEFNFSIGVPETFWRTTGKEGIRQLRFPKEYKSQIYEIHVAAALSHLSPDLKKIETALVGKDFGLIQNLTFKTFFWEIDRRLESDSNFDYYSDILSKIRDGLFKNADVAVRPRCSKENFNNIKEIEKSKAGTKAGRPRKEVSDSEFWIVVI